MTLHLAEMSTAVAPARRSGGVAWLRCAHRPSHHDLVAAAREMPELNPVENVWQFIRDNWLSNRIFESYGLRRRAHG